MSASGMFYLTCALGVRMLHTDGRKAAEAARAAPVICP